MLFALNYDNNMFQAAQKNNLRIIPTLGYKKIDILFLELFCSF